MFVFYILIVSLFNFFSASRQAEPSRPGIQPASEIQTADILIKNGKI
ncbi:MAG: hypothetical protein JWQ14_2688, partial [Adhaeribacter sp.]|nr:hypothetical protein [Adhaeribacter sp.]